MKLVEYLASDPKGNTKATLNYIQDMSREIGVDISSLDLSSVFKGSASDGLTHSKKEINKILFSLEREQMTENRPLTLSPEVILALKGYEEDCLERENREIDRLINSHLGTIGRYHEEIDIRIRHIRTLEERRRGLSFNFCQTIESVLQNKFYSFQSEELQGNGVCISLLTDKVVLKYDRGDQVMRLPMGRFEIRWFLPDNTIQVLAHENNIVVQGFIFPFISGGNICWGNSESLVSKLRAENKMADVFNLLQTLLTSYSSESNPYMPFEAFDSRGTIGSKPWREFIQEQIEEEVSNDGKKEKVKKVAGESYPGEFASLHEEAQEHDDEGEREDEDPF